MSGIQEAYGLFLSFLRDDVSEHTDSFLTALGPLLSILHVLCRVGNRCCYSEGAMNQLHWIKQQLLVHQHYTHSSHEKWMSQSYYPQTIFPCPQLWSFSGPLTPALNTWHKILNAMSCLLKCYCLCLSLLQFILGGWGLSLHKVIWGLDFLLLHTASGCIRMSRQILVFI